MSSTTIADAAWPGSSRGLGIVVGFRASVVWKRRVPKTHASLQIPIREKNSGAPRTPGVSRNKLPAAGPSLPLLLPPAVVT